MLASVVVDIQGADAPGALTYQVPDHLREAVGIGSYVQVPLGPRQVLGYVVGLPRSAPHEGLKSINAVVHPSPLFDSALFELASRMAHRYHASLAEALRCIVPEGIATRLETSVALRNLPDPEAVARALEKRSPGLASLVRLLATSGSMDVRALRAQWPGKDLPAALARLRARGWIQENVRLQTPPARARLLRVLRPALPHEALAAEANTRRARAPAQARILDSLAARCGQPMLLSEAVRGGGSRAAIRALASEGILVEEQFAIRRDPWVAPRDEREPLALTPAQERAAASLEEMLAAGQHDTVLLHGVTASGKTEVYLRAIAAALARGRGALMLLPEIALTAQTVSLFRARFGAQVALLHSRLSAGERHDEWQRLRSGEAQIAVGPRSALFAPCTPGIIILDEEHEPSYKQENSPRYDTRRMAIERARLTDALVVLASATPSVESYFLAQKGDYRLVELAERVPGRTVPPVDVVDLRATRPSTLARLFSPLLHDALADRLGRGEQCILFVNRRGFASFILCRDCGYTARCPHCSVSLTLHAADHSLRCHHCNHRRQAPTTCPQCGGDRVHPLGMGTERVEAEVRQAFPSARVLRMDRDTTATKNAYGRLYHAFREGQADILIGTQMVAKGLDFPGVTLVGVVAADVALNIPDFRASERTFQLLTQVAGRAGRGERAGRVVIQTYNPEHYAVEAARTHDYAAFHAREIDFRRELGYPPYGTLVNILSGDPDASAAQERASEAAAAVAREAGQEGWAVEVLGPAPAPLARLKRRYRWHAVVRGPRDAEVQEAVHRGLASLPARRRDALTVDVDPVSML